MKYFVMADIHSYYDEMMYALNLKGFDPENPEHKIILIGDVFDRGDKTIEVFNFIYDMILQDKLIYVLGNHEDLLIDAIQRGFLNSYDYSNGTAKTVLAFAKELAPNCHESTDSNILCDLARRFGIIRFLMQNCVDYYETKKYVFTHGYIPVLEDTEGNHIYNSKWRKESSKAFRSSRWYNGMALRMYENVRIPRKTIVCGHYHTSYGNVRDEYKWDLKMDLKAKEREFESKDLFKPFIKDGIIAIDGCTSFTGFVNCVVIEDEEK